MLSTRRRDFLEILAPNSNTITLRFELQSPKTWQPAHATLRDPAARQAPPPHPGLLATPSTPATSVARPATPSTPPSHWAVPRTRPSHCPNEPHVTLRSAGSTVRPRVFFLLPVAFAGAVPVAPPAGAQAPVTRPRGAASGPSP